MALMEALKLISIALAVAFGMAFAAWVYAKLMQRSLQNANEEAQLGKERLKRLRPKWLDFIGQTSILLALSIHLFAPIPVASSWIFFAVLPVPGIAAAIYYTRLLRTEAEDSPVRPIAKRHRRVAFAVAALCGIVAVTFLFSTAGLAAPQS